MVAPVQPQHLKSSFRPDAIHDDRRAERWLVADRQTGQVVCTPVVGTSGSRCRYVRQDFSGKEG